ncbi:hypothetical protein DBR06_SOUSAS5610055, partial [Sousa chinensis]
GRHLSVHLNYLPSYYHLPWVVRALVGDGAGPPVDR